MSSPALEAPLTFDQVCFSYRKKWVFQDLSFAIPPGITVLMGPNGAGKTTLLSLAAGELSPRSGRVIIGNREGAQARAQVGFLPQRFGFVGSMRLKDAVMHASWAAGAPRERVPKLADDALAATNLGGLAREQVRTLSGGQRQRLGIACALSSGPAILLLDEPSVGLDPVQRKSLRELLLDLGPRVPILLSTHLVDDVVGVADHIVVVAEGSVRFAGSADELVAGSTRQDRIAALEQAYVEKVS